MSDMGDLLAAGSVTLLLAKLGTAFVVDSKIEDQYKDTIGSICETIRRTDDLSK